MFIQRFNRMMSIVVFAEAGDFNTVHQLMEETVPLPKEHPKSKTRLRHIYGMILFGALSLACYLTLFKHQNWVNTNFSKGGVYAFYPMATAFLFSFIHGAFASHLISVFGLNPKK